MISFEEFKEQWLEEIKAGDPSTTQLGHRFAEKILRDWHGIDAAVFLKQDLAEGIEGDSWMLIQSKYGSSYTGVDTITSEAQKLFATLEGKRESLSS